MNQNTSKEGGNEIDTTAITIKRTLFERGFSFIRIGFSFFVPVTGVGILSYLYNTQIPLFIIVGGFIASIALIFVGIVCALPYIIAGWKLKIFKKASKITPRTKENIEPFTLEACLRGMKELVMGVRRKKRGLGEILKAIADFDRVIGQSPTSKHAYYCKAIAIMELTRSGFGDKRNLKQAEYCIERALEIDSKFVEAKNLKDELRKLKRR